jgi:hypothetical protein
VAFGGTSPGGSSFPVAKDPEVTPCCITSLLTDVKSNDMSVEDICGFCHMFCDRVSGIMR